MRDFILRVFFLRELIFADRDQSAKFAKIRTHKIFMLHSIVCAVKGGSTFESVYEVLKYTCLNIHIQQTVRHTVARMNKPRRVVFCQCKVIAKSVMSESFAFCLVRLNP